MFFEDFIRTPSNKSYLIKNDGSGRFLYNAIESNQYNFVKFLIKNGTNVNVNFKFQHSQYNSPLQLAINKKHWAIVKLLHDNNAILHEFNSEFLIDENFHIFELLCNETNLNKISTDASNMYPLTIAILNKAEKIVKYLINIGTKIQYCDFVYSIQYNTCPLTVLKHGLIQKIDPYLILSFATKYKRWSLIEFIFEEEICEYNDIINALAIANIPIEKTTKLLYYSLVLDHLKNYCLQA